MGNDEWVKVEKTIILEDGEMFVNIWKALYFRPQKVMKGDYQLITLGGRRGRTYREGGRRGKEKTIPDSGRLVLTNKRLIWLQQRGTLKKTIHPIFEIPVSNISGISIQGRITKRINISDGVREYQFRIGGDEKITEFQKSVNELTSIQSISKEEPEEPSKSPIEQLKELKEVLDLGVITQEEFEEKKKILLNKI